MSADDEVAKKRAEQDAKDRITSAITAVPSVERLVRLQIVPAANGHLVAAKVALPQGLTLEEATQTLETIHDQVHEAVENISAVYIEPDVYRPANDPAPPTDVFVLKSSD